mgnify:CR=1 FL=1
MGLTSLTQESLLCLLCHDAEHGARVLTLVPADAWDPPYKEVFRKAVAFWEQEKQPPGEHTLDLFDELERGDKARKQQYRDLYHSIQESHAGINAKYVLGQVHRFLRGQRLRTGILDAVGLLERDKIDDAERAIQQSLKGVLDVFHPGTLFHQLNVAEILTDDRVAMPTDIPLLDDHGFGPTPGELHLFIAPPKRGKSWWLVHLAKQAVWVARKRVVYISLELSERRVAQRFLQTFLMVAKRRPPKGRPLVNRRFVANDLGQLERIELDELKKLSSFADENIARKLQKKLVGFGRRSPLVIRQFPTGMLSVRELRGYLDSLEATERIVPDLLIVDYADLMSIGSKDYRHELGNVYRDLRGLAVERNLALATASQANRESAGKNLLTDRGVAEDYSKIATADCVITYSQTDQERGQNLARLYVSSGRNDEDKLLVAITQNYAVGQFCLSSVRMMANKYWLEVARGAEDGEPEDDKSGKRKREHLK